MRTLYGVYVIANCVRLFTIHANGPVSERAQWVSTEIRYLTRSPGMPYWSSEGSLLVEGGAR